MAFLLGALGILSTILYYVFIIRRGSEAASEVADTVGGAVGKAKWWMWKKKNLKPPHELIDSPVLSAVTLTYRIMRIKGELSDTGWAFLRNDLRQTLRLDEQATEDAIAEARFIAQGINDPDRFIAKQSQYLSQHVSLREFEDLHDMIERATQVDGNSSHLQEDALSRLLYVS